MAGANTLDNMGESFSDEHIPFQFRKEKDKEGTHRWLKDWFEHEYEKAYPRFIMYKRYLNMYKNLDEWEGEYLGQNYSRYTGKSRKKPKVKDNIVYSLTEHRVAQVSKTKISLAFIPRVQNDQDDINAAKAAKMLVRARYEETDFDGDMIRMDRVTYLLGHSLYERGWDKDAGPLAPSYVRAKEKFGSTGEKIIDEATGTEIDLKKEVRVGDTCGKLWMPYEFFPEPNRFKLCECNYLNTFEWKFREEVEADYNLEKGTIQSCEFVKWDFATNKIERPNNQVLVHTFWHKPTKYFPKGCKIVWCEDLILEWIDFPFEDGKLPFVEDKDIEVEREFWGRPYIVNIEQLYKVNNSLLSGMARNHAVLNAPKVMFPEGAVDIKNLNNEYSTLTYRGNVEPKVLQHQYVNRGELEFQKHLQSRAGELSSVFEISKGVVPPGITAASAIRYLDEQEHQRATPSISKRKRRILDITRLEVSHMAQFYQESDERTIRYVGENNEFIIKSFKKIPLKKIADVRYENVSALSDTKTGAIADIIDLNAVTQNDPVFKPKQIIKLLDLGLNDAFKDEATYAVDTARTILEMILDGEEVPEPTKTDGLLEFYGVFGAFVESLTYKTKLDPVIKAKLDAYILGLEFLMWQKSQDNAKFAELLLGYEKFPMFFSVPTPPMPPAPGGPAPAPAAATDKMELQKKEIENQMNEQGEV